jgi:PIN domain nuclease of toxin-antitoxin system
MKANRSKRRHNTRDPCTEIEKVVDQILAISFITLSHLSHSAWDILIDLDLPESHDRMIVADALDRKIPLITSDDELRSVAGLRTIWR